MGTLTDLAMQSGVTGGTATAPAPARRGATIGTNIDPTATMSPYEAAILAAQRAGVSMPTGMSAAGASMDRYNGGAMPADASRLGTTQPGTGAAMTTAGTLGLDIMAPNTQQPMQAPGSPGANTAVQIGNAAGAVAAPRTNINDPAAMQTPPGAAQAIPGPNGNAQQMTPQAQAMIQEIMRQRAMAATQQAAQGMADRRGVFAGQQQGVAMPTPQMPGVPVRR
jgi:hypothetical protein